MFCLLLHGDDKSMPFATYDGCDLDPFLTSPVPLSLRLCFCLAGSDDLGYTPIAVRILFTGYDLASDEGTRTLRRKKTPLGDSCQNSTGLFLMICPSKRRDFVSE